MRSKFKFHHITFESKMPQMPERQCYQYTESVAPKPILASGLWNASGIK